MCMYTCPCMSWIYSISWIHRYMYISIPSPSRNSSHAVMVSCLSWFPWTPPRAPSAVMFASHAFLPATSDISLTLRRKNRVCCFGGKKIATSKRREMTSPPQGDHYWNGKGTEIKGKRRFAQAFPELFPETKGTHTAGQTCGSSRAAESQRRALDFSERICCRFLISKCRGDRHLALCTTSVLAFGEPQGNSQIQFFLRRNTFSFRHCTLEVRGLSHELFTRSFLARLSKGGKFLVQPVCVALFCWPKCASCGWKVRGSEQLSTWGFRGKVVFICL